MQKVMMIQVELDEYLKKDYNSDKLKLVYLMNC